jgi:hypothetical protein
MNMNSRRSAPKALIASTVISILLLAMVPGAVSAATGASLTQTAATDCAGGVVEFRGDAWELPASTNVFVDLMFQRQDGLWENPAYPATTAADGTVSYVFTLTGQSGAQTGDSAVFTVWDYSGTAVAGASVTLDCTVASTGPTTKIDCQHGGWAAFPGMRNTGDCMRAVKGR